MTKITVESLHPRKNFFLLVIFIVVGLGTALFLVGRLGKNENLNRMAAVFLSNEQVYFGKIVKENKEVLVLENVYYLKANAAMVEDTTATESATQATAQLSLIKLGDELHSPEDRMTINKQHILFYELMKWNGTIMDAITNHEQSSN